MFRLRRRSLIRGTLLSLAAFVGSLLLAGFPNIARLHGSHWQWAALAAAVWGLAETTRCLRRRWDFYHAGVLLLIYADLMIVAMNMAVILFLTV